jgi:micrococcal nuclease
MTTSPPAGWYPDPEVPGGKRYWDGTAWTPHRHPAGAPGPGPAPVPAPARRTWSPVAVLAVAGAGAFALVVALVVALGLVGALAGGSDTDPVAASSSRSMAEPPPRPTGSLPVPGPATSTRGPTPGPATAPPTKPSTRPTPTPRPKPSSAPSTAPSSAATTLLPVVGVSDGDTIKVGVAGRTERVRVIGIDTPELAGRECYAQQAASRMQSLVQGRSVRLVADPTQDDRDRYDRLLRHVVLADGRSVAQLLIAGGYGREYTYDRPYRGRADHLAAQASAKQARRGLWGPTCSGGTPVPLVHPTPSSSSSCLIKGNISSEGEKIYHLPGQQYYDVTKISLATGERWFCSEQQAVAAGWRKSLR